MHACIFKSEQFVGGVYCHEHGEAAEAKAGLCNMLEVLDMLRISTMRALYEGAEDPGQPPDREGEN